MRRAVIAAAGAVVATALAIPAYAAGPSQAPTQGQSTEYVVLYEEGVSLDEARAAVQEAGGTILKENTAVGLATVRSASSDFASVVRSHEALVGAATNRVIGHAPRGSTAPDGLINKSGRLGGAASPLSTTQATVQAAPARSSAQTAAAASRANRRAGEEPLAGMQWDMEQINATASGSHRREPGDRRVLVGIIDTGVDASHPDIAPNFNHKLSRNFTTDIPVDADGNEVDGPCEVASCVDPADVDENSHGTHVASTVASPRNGLGIAGVAPNVSLVNLRAGQDSGFFFLQPSVDALTFAGDNGIDVVNMSFFIDPWLFNCVDNPADSPQDQAEQQIIIEAAQRALDYARARGVTLVAAAGNEAADYTKEFIDTGSPNFVSEPGEEPRARTIPPSCISMPSEGNGVIPVSSTGISTRKAYYSSFGNGYVTVGAPGGDVFDTADNKRDLANGIWAAYPEDLARARGELNEDGTPNSEFVVRDCSRGTCAYYQVAQGTSMASPHAAGVAALIVSRFGRTDRVHGGLTLDPRVTEAVLRGTATDTACPEGGSFTYVRLVEQQDGSFQEVTDTHVCEGGTRSNGFWGDGIIDALRAVSRR